MNINRHKSYKWCFVPGCGNNLRKTPNKIFLSVPMNHKRRKRWFEAARRELPKSNSRFLCCEDHFNLEEDMENYTRFKLMGCKIFMKADVVPHKFACQPGRKMADSGKVRLTSVKRERRRMIEELLAERDKQQNDGHTSTSASVITSVGAAVREEREEKDGGEERNSRFTTKHYTTSEQNLFEVVLLKSEPMIQDEEQIFTETFEEQKIEVSIKDEIFEEETPTIKEEPPDFDEIKPKSEVFSCEKCSEILPHANNFCINCH